MIVLKENEGSGAGQAAVGNDGRASEPLPQAARRAVEAAAAVQRGELDLEQASRRYGAPAALIEVWQRALANAGLTRRRPHLAG